MTSNSEYSLGYRLSISAIRRVSEVLFSTVFFLIIIYLIPDEFEGKISNLLTNLISAIFAAGFCLIASGYILYSTVIELFISPLRFGKVYSSLVGPAILFFELSFLYYDYEKNHAPFPFFWALLSVVSIAYFAIGWLIISKMER